MSDYSVSASYCYGMTILEIAVLSEDIACKHVCCMGTMCGYVTVRTINVNLISGGRCSVLMVLYCVQKMSHTTIYLGCKSLIHDVNNTKWAQIQYVLKELRLDYLMVQYFLCKFSNTL